MSLKSSLQRNLDRFFKAAGQSDFNIRAVTEGGLAVDGSRLVLPSHSSVKEEFGEHGFGPDAGSKRSPAIGSLLYDV